MIIYNVHKAGPFILGPETPDHTGVENQCLFILRHKKPDHTGAAANKLDLAVSAAIAQDINEMSQYVVLGQAHVYCLMFLCNVLSWFQENSQNQNQALST